MPSVGTRIKVAEKQTSHDQGLSRSLLHLHFAATLDEKRPQQAIPSRAQFDVIECHTTLTDDHHETKLTGNEALIQ